MTETDRDKLARIMTDADCASDEFPFQDTSRADAIIAAGWQSPEHIKEYGYQQWKAGFYEGRDTAPSAGDVIEQVIRVLGMHQQIAYDMCRCEEWRLADSHRERVADRHREHVAEQLADAGYLATPPTDDVIEEATENVAHTLWLRTGCITWRTALVAVKGLAAAGYLATPVQQDDEWCREDGCRYRHWRSGPMPTHKRGKDCPLATPVQQDTDGAVATGEGEVTGK